MGAKDAKDAKDASTGVSDAPLCSCGKPRKRWPALNGKPEWFGPVCEECGAKLSRTNEALCGWMFGGSRRKR